MVTQNLPFMVRRWQNNGAKRSYWITLERMHENFSKNIEQIAQIIYSHENRIRLNCTALKVHGNVTKLLFESKSENDLMNNLSEFG